MKDWREIPERAIASFRDRIGQPDGKDCWPWLGWVQSNGYGAFTIRIEPGTHGRQVCWLAHRLSYILAHGDIAAGFTIDHLCRNRRCVNPAHMEPVSMRVNNLRGESASATNAAKTHCPRNHPLTGKNLRSDSRACRTCKNDRRRRPPSIPVRAPNGAFIGWAQAIP